MSFIFQNGEKISYFENRQSKIESTIFMDLGNNCKQVHTVKNSSDYVVFYEMLNLKLKFHRPDRGHQGQITWWICSLYTKYVSTI